MIASSPHQPKEQIFFDGKCYFASLLTDIESSTTSIDLETYIFAADQLGKQLITALTAAAKHGVKVRVLVDGAGTPQWNSNLINNLEKAGAQTRIFHPFPWRLWQWSRALAKGPTILKAIYLLLKINSRNHRKICIIDNKVAYIGSFNICQFHLSKEQHGEGWRDTGVKLSETDLSELVNAFEASWSHLRIHERIRAIFRHIYTNPIVRLNNTWHRRRILHKNLLHRIKQCKLRIWITNAYFVPDTFLLKRLIEAAKRGIDVRILLPKKSDVMFMPWASKSFYENLLKAGVRIFEYLPSILHAKTLILDDWMTIGSSNLNHRSFLHDLEVDINIRQAESKLMLENQFLLDIAQAKEISLKHWEKLPLHQRIVGRLALYVKYII